MIGAACSGSVPARVMLAVAACVAVLVVGMAADAANAAFPGRNGAVAFVGRRGGEDVLYLRAGRSRVRGLLARGTLADPAFSPLGRRIAFDRASRVGRDVYVMNVDGSDLRRLTEAGGREEHPTWSPAGGRL